MGKSIFAAALEGLGWSPAEIADLTQGIRVLKKGDVIEWGENDGFKAYGMIEEIDHAQGKATVFLLDFVNGKLSPQPGPKNKQTVDLKAAKNLRKTDKPLAGMGGAATDREPGPHVSLSVADLTDDEVYEQYKRQLGRSSREEAEARQRSARVADLSADPDRVGLTGEGRKTAKVPPITRGQKTAAAIERVEERQEDLLEYWLGEHHAGNVIPRYYEEILRERGLA